SRLAEYFLEMGQTQPAMAIAGSLKSSFASDLGGLVARANVAGATRDLHELNEIVAAIQPYLERGDDDLLPVDRRVSLALALAQARRMDLARTQLERCLEMFDAAAIRSLPTGVLFRMQALGKALNLEIDDPQLRTLARALVPPEMRARL